ncbi:hypothetical protein [Aeromicrobium sp. CTD01-1L150]
MSASSLSDVAVVVQIDAPDDYDEYERADAIRWHLEADSEPPF